MSASLDARPTSFGAGGRGSSESGSGGTSQGEALRVWGLWTLLLTAIFVTYSRLEPAELYHVTRSGLAGGSSRTLVALNFPVAMIAIALVLVALDALPARAWWIGAPAILLCAVTAWPGVVDDQDLDARPVNVVPTIGVVLAFGLTVAAVRRSGREIASRRPFDRVRVAVIAVVTVISIPWILADLGVFAPEWLFIMERPITGSDGNTTAAVHLGHHHGLDGALFVISAALLSRTRLHSRAHRTATTLYVSLVFAYGAVNLAQDAWHEQVVKRDWSGWKIPDAVHPSLTPIWLVILGIAGVTALVLDREQRRHRDATSEGA